MNHPAAPKPLHLTDELPLLADLDQAAQEVLQKTVVRVTMRQGKIVFRLGDACLQFPLVVSGTIRVQRVTESGREILLCRVKANEVADPVALLAFVRGKRD